MEQELELTTPSPLEMRVTRRFAAPRGRVFDAYTRQELLADWMSTPAFPLLECSVDPREGGQARYVWGGPGEHRVGLTCTFVEIARPHRIVQTEIFDQDWTGGEMRVQTDFEEVEGITTVVTTIRFRSEQARDTVLGSPMKEGMATNFDRLEALLSASRDAESAPPLLARHPVHLGLGATAVQEPAFTGMQWYEEYGARHAADGEEGRLVSMHTFDTSWDSWEMHPLGHEVVVCVHGEMTLVQEIDGHEVRTKLRAGEYAINDPGVWHTADVESEATALFITAGAGTEQRGR